MSEPGEISRQAEAIRRRMAQGLLLEPRVRLAAHLGDAAARACLRADSPPQLQLPEEGAVEWLAEYAVGLPQFGLEVCTRAAVAAARPALALLESTSPHDRVPRMIFRAAETWLECPCEQHRQDAEDIAASEGTTDFLAGILGPGQREDAAHAVVAAASVAGATSAQDAADDVARAISWAPERAVEALKAELIPWALG